MSSTPLAEVAHRRPPDGVDRRLRHGLAAFLKPVPALTTVACGLLMLACNVNAVLGPHAVAFKLHYAQWFMLAVVVLVGHRLLGTTGMARSEAARSALQVLPWLLAFCVLIGVHGLVSNGFAYRDMASNYWDTDAFAPTSRRLAVPVLAHVLGFELKLYVLFWYGLLFLTVWASLHWLVGRGLSRFEAFSLATSSILAYGLVAPGYGEIAVLLLGLLALRFRLSLPERIVVAALMIATHEVATPFVAVAVILAGDPEDRQTWLVAFGLLYLAFGLSYIVTWHGDLDAALLRADRPGPTDERTSAALVMLHPDLAALGAVLAYKLYWLPVFTALRRHGSRLMALLTLASLVLIVVGSDTSRLVQFSSLSLFLVVSAELNRYPTSVRRLLATANLLVPSVYVATNAGILWGPGLYSVYLQAAAAWGLPFGRVFWQ